MIEISFFAVELFFAVLWVLIRIAVWIRQKKILWKREAVLLLMYVNLAVIIRFTFFPMGANDGHVQPLIFSPQEILPFKLNLIPFVNMFNYGNQRSMLLNVIGNMVMFIPSGIILPVVYRRLNHFLKVTAAGMGISLSIELIQLLFIERTTDVDDLILNTCGVMVGYGIYTAARIFLKNIRLCRNRG